MILDVPTLTLAGSFVALLSGAMLVFAWYQYREMSPVLWWAAADFVLAAAIALLAFGGVAANGPMLALAFGCLAGSSALVWASARRFNGLKPHYGLMLLGPAIVLGVNAFPIGAALADLRGGLGTLFNAAYLVAAAWTLLVQDGEKLRSRWPLVGFILTHTAVLIVGAATAATSSAGIVPLPAVESLFGIIHFEALIYMVGTTIFVVAAMRESSELRHKRAASIDSLTGLANRGAFFDRAARLVERCRQDGVPYAVIALDLDHFKAVNDGYGHATGDRTLQIFGEAAQKALRPNDALGRIGGEEFAAVLPGSGAEAAVAMAERIRRAFAMAATFVDGQPVNATVSAGTAATDQPEVPLDALMQEADAALYRAKFAGRNRVECAPGGSGQQQPRLTLLRIA